MSEQVKALLQTYDDGGNWEMEPQQPAPKEPSRHRKTDYFDVCFNLLTKTNKCA
jgi:hypothetical protein